MNEEIMDNQVQEELDYLLPDDYEEEVEETTETESEESEELSEETENEELQETEETEQKDEQTEEVTESLNDLEVKFLHETKKLSDIPKEDLKNYIQKGMNHDRLSEKFNIANEKLEKIKELSNLYGMDENTMVEALYDQYFKNTAEKEGTTPEAIKARVETQKKDRNAKMYERFASKYSDVKAQDIPQSVWDAVKQGEDLTLAYSDYLKEQQIESKTQETNTLKARIEELENKIKMQEQNQKVKKKAPVKSTTNNGSDDAKEDDFIAGFLGD